MRVCARVCVCALVCACLRLCAHVRACVRMCVIVRARVRYCAQRLRARRHGEHERGGTTRALFVIPERGAREQTRNHENAHAEEKRGSCGRAERVEHVHAGARGARARA